MRERSRWSAMALSLALALSALTATPGVAQSGGPIPDPVTTYAPLVYLHPDEKLLPYRADLYVPKSDLYWNRDDGCPPVLKKEQVPLGILGAGGYSENIDLFGDCRPDEVIVKLDPPPWTTTMFAAPGFSDPADLRLLQERAEGFYLDAPTDILGGRPLGKSPTYYEYEPGKYIIYWFFYASNKQTLDGDGSPVVNEHDGDWEHVVVRLDAEDHATDVAYYQHECDPLIVPWADLTGHEPFGSYTGLWGSTHPIVYSALGSHASYPGPHRRNEPIGTNCPYTDFRGDAAQKGEAWKAWTGAGLVDARHESWYRYGGIWGPPSKDLLTTDLDIVGRFPWSSGGLGPSAWRLEPGEVVPTGWEVSLPAEPRPPAAPGSLYMFCRSSADGADIFCVSNALVQFSWKDRADNAEGFHIYVRHGRSANGKCDGSGLPSRLDWTPWRLYETVPLQAAHRWSGGLMYGRSVWDDTEGPRVIDSPPMRVAYEPGYPVAQFAISAFNSSGESKRTVAQTSIYDLDVALGPGLCDQY